MHYIDGDKPCFFYQMGNHILMLFFELFLRFGSLAFLLLLSLLSLRDCRSLAQRIILLGLCISTISYMISSSADVMTAPPWLLAITDYLLIPNTAFIWLFGLSLFEDDFRIKRHHILLSLAYVIPAFVICLYNPHWWSGSQSWDVVLLNTYGLCLMAYLVYRIIAGYQNDLVDRRRKSRLFFGAALAVVSVSLSLSEINLLPVPPMVFVWIKNIAVFVLSLWALLWLTRLDEDELSFERKAAVMTPLKTTMLDSRDTTLKTRLISFMEDDKAFMEHGLTIRGLAHKISVPEHRLRHVINKGLGYRNFSAFLNYYRIRAIKSALNKPENEHLPILTLAMDYGYNSLAPFNRAFRESEGMTPSEYRQRPNGDG